MTDDLEPTGASEGTVAHEPIGDPGLPEHQWRPTDVDADLERRAERQVSTLFGLGALLFLGFCVAYFTVDADQTFLGWNGQNFALGATFGGGLLLIGVGIIQWAKKLMGDHEIVEERHPSASSDEDRTAVMIDVNAGLNESGIARRPMIRNSLLLSLGALGLPVIVALRDLGPLPHDQRRTVWKKGMRVVNDVSGTPIKPEQLQVGQLVNAEPAILFEEDADGERVLHGTEALQVKSKAAVIVVRMRPEDITPSKGRENWGVDGILCYSKICTHVGCPISLWEQQTHHLLCPCHQSTFDLADNGKVIFGPAHRPLPQLPLGVDSEGYLIAMSDFPEIVAPSYPELARDQKKLDKNS
ncbi:cytochrome bc1 complex Rieske iron-sulfur subunit [Aeromicrobium terrae]|uniref:Cytochrome bc1 complex Rieske iron-sulfur subunit n=1 Tax=Aeromicrobium terrae TaxID=2498846 RepID=A0A5C8NLS9_9ACTN|nr:Rieske (2Fe-2S) protein [Aeromicrobium terrae]TXL62804.1 Rieske 2Fe-2S domain-containing protein [Aeromicrobium terrae]